MATLRTSQVGADSLPDLVKCTLHAPPGQAADEGLVLRGGEGPPLGPMCLLVVTASIPAFFAKWFFLGLST